jgi:hypothetical protein
LTSTQLILQYTCVVIFVILIDVITVAACILYNIDTYWICLSRQCMWINVLLCTIIKGISVSGNSSQFLEKQLVETTFVNIFDRENIFINTPLSFVIIYLVVILQYRYSNIRLLINVIRTFCIMSNITIWSTTVCRKIGISTPLVSGKHWKCLWKIQRVLPKIEPRTSGMTASGLTNWAIAPNSV